MCVNIINGIYISSRLYLPAWGTLLSASLPMTVLELLGSSLEHQRAMICGWRLFIGTITIPAASPDQYNNRTLDPPHIWIHVYTFINAYRQ